MKIQKIDATTNFSGQENLKFTDKFYAYTKNQGDMNDTVVVPRTIFKGYLAFMAGTTFTSLAGLARKQKWLNTSLNIAGIATCLYGTWAFVRPFVVKDTPGVSSKK